MKYRDHGWLEHDVFRLGWWKGYKHGEFSARDAAAYLEKTCIPNDTNMVTCFCCGTVDGNMGDTWRRDNLDRFRASATKAE